MRSDRKIFIFIEVMLAIAVFITAAAVLYENTEKKVDRVAVVLQNSEDEKWASLKYGLRMAAKDVGVEVHIVSSESDFSVEEQKQMLEQELTSNTSAIIFQPIIGEGEAELIDNIRKKTDVMLVESDIVCEDGTGYIPVTKTDQYELGKALAEAMLSDYSGSIGNKKLGILSRADNSVSIQERRQGFLDAIAEKGAVVAWDIAYSFSKSEWHSVSDREAVDIVIALDDDSLVGVSALSMDKNLHGALIYGIGHSMESVYYLDTGVVRCLTVPDEFNIGYQSLISVLNEKKSRIFEDSYFILRRENLFTKEHQELILTMSQ